MSKTSKTRDWIGIHQALSSVAFAEFKRDGFSTTDALEEGNSFAYAAKEILADRLSENFCNLEED